VYGENFGCVQQDFSDHLKTVYSRRNKLKSIADAARSSGNLDKFRKIVANNLGRVKLDRQHQRHKASIKSIVGKAINQLAKKSRTVCYESLTFRGHKTPSKNQNRRLSAWVKGYVADRLEQTFARMGVEGVEVNAAYSSQVDSRFGVLLGTRYGDRFIGFDGVELVADINAAINIKARRSDPEIERFTKARDVLAILIRRTAESIRQVLSGELLSEAASVRDGQKVLYEQLREAVLRLIATKTLTQSERESLLSLFV
jgi:transposase